MPSATPQIWIRSSRDKRKISDAEKLANVDSNALNRLARSQAVVCVAFASGGNSVIHGAPCEISYKVIIKSNMDWTALNFMQLSFYIIVTFIFIIFRENAFFFKNIFLVACNLFSYLRIIFLKRKAFSLRIMNIKLTIRMIVSNFELLNSHRFYYAYIT